MGKLALYTALAAITPQPDLAITIILRVTLLHTVPPFFREWANLPCTRPWPPYHPTRPCHNYNFMGNPLTHFPLFLQGRLGWKTCPLHGPGCHTAPLDPAITIIFLVTLLHTVALSSGNGDTCWQTCPLHSPGCHTTPPDPAHHPGCGDQQVRVNKSVKGQEFMFLIYCCIQGGAEGGCGLHWSEAVQGYWSGL